MKTVAISLLLLLTAALPVDGQVPTNNPLAQRVLLPNGWSLSPAGKSLPLGDLPLNIQLSRSKKLLAVTNNGQSVQSIQLINVQSESLADEVVVAKSWYGLQFSSDEKRLYASGGNDNTIMIFSILEKKLKLTDSLRLGKPWPNKISPTGIALDESAGLLYAVTKENNSLYIVDLKLKTVLKQIALGSEAYACVLSPNRKVLYISLWGADEVAVLDTKTFSIVQRIKTEGHPNELLLNQKGSALFVANANSNSVSVVATRNNKVVETISAAMYPTKLTGSTTNGLALSENEKTLFIANADNNCLAVFDVSEIGQSRSRGFIPTGWYPTNVKCAGGKIFVANGKGFSSLPNPDGPKPIMKPDGSGHHQSPPPRDKTQYIGGLFKGSLSIIDDPSEEQLRSYSQQVYRNSPFTAEREKLAEGLDGNPVPRKLGDPTPIKYVFYVIKENRTYDQVFGDMKRGNSDSSLCLFPEKITPNMHALANEFVLLDNFYVDSEVSADGHNWSMGAYATDYVEKTWPTSYGGRGGTYEYEGTRKIAFPTSGFIWDYCQRAGLTYRSYGEFSEAGDNVKSLKGHLCKAFPDFDQDVKDITRFEIWKKDFDSLLSINAVPQFSTIKLPNDHTSGQRKGKYTPIAAVADNDLALGLLVEHISSSKIWNESAIFVLEDDAQNGSDHVDAHRSPALVISPYVRRGELISKMYSTTSILRTMELILGLPPMSQYDAAALPMFHCFAPTPDFKSYRHKPSKVDLDARNVADNGSSRRSDRFNFEREDRAPDLDLNEVVWKFVKGEGSEMPMPRRSAFAISIEVEKD